MEEMGGMLAVGRGNREIADNTQQENNKNRMNGASEGRFSTTGSITNISSIPAIPLD